MFVLFKFTKNYQFMLGILFFIKRKKLLKNGLAPIYVRITVNNQSSECSISKSIIPSHWISQKGRVRNNTLLNKQLNYFIDQQEFKINELLNEIIREGKEVTSNEIMNHFRGDSIQKNYLLEIYEEHNNKLKELIGRDVALATYKRHCTSLNLLKEFLLAKMHKTDILIKEVNVVFFEEYKHYLMTVRNNSNNTAVKYLKNLGKIVQIAKTRNLIEKNPINDLKLRIDEVRMNFLTDDELNRLTQLTIDIKRLDMVRDVFLFCCYTGLAYIDVKNLNLDNIEKSEDNLWLHVTRQKTNSICYIPILKPAKAILDKYDGKLINRKLLPVPSNQKMNAYLKELADLSGIKKELSTHCARHTFATTITLANKVTIENVSKMLGHKSLRMTLHYARILNLSIANDMKMVDSILEKK